MAPDRGPQHSVDSTAIPSPSSLERPATPHPQSPTPEESDTSPPPLHFSLRGVLVGLGIGVIICFSNTYFGLQTGWVSGMAMPSALLGFAWFRTFAPIFHRRATPFSPVENVLVQSVAGSVGTMPLGCGFVGVLPALAFLLAPDEGGPIRLSLGRLVVWALGIAFFGVLIAVPLRRQVLVRERLKFPSGTATALMIEVLHGSRGTEQGGKSNAREGDDEEREAIDSVMAPLVRSYSMTLSPEELEEEEEERKDMRQGDWHAKIRLLSYSFGLSAFYTFVSYFLPILHEIPFLGNYLASTWLITFNASPAYVGQGIIMGPATCMHMLLGAILGWCVLSPVAKIRGWAPGPVDDWAEGSKGWIVWVSLAIMLVDSVVSLGWLVLRPTIKYAPGMMLKAMTSWRDGEFKLPGWMPGNGSRGGYESLRRQTSDVHSVYSTATSTQDDDYPPSQLISLRVTVVGLILSLVAAVVAVQYSFSGLMPASLTILALLFALLLSVMGVRALGETDLNPVSGISKLTQLIFAFVVPRGHKNAVIINLLAGALSESSALQAGDLMQDLKAGYIVGAAPNAQFWGQVIGSAVGAVVSALVYRLYTKVYEIPREPFQIPTGFVWIYTARLVTGQGLPPMVPQWAFAVGLLFTFTTILRIYLNAGSSSRKAWANWVPGGIAVAIGMYNTPAFTFARAIGGLIHWYWYSYQKKSETPIIILASGLILGEGLFSIVNLLLASLKVPHL